MKRTINTKKVKELLEKQSKRQVELANYLKIPKTTVSMSLKGDRNFPMGYVFELANFFNVNPLSLTIGNNTKKQ